MISDLWPGRIITVYGEGQTIKDRNTGEGRDVIVIHAMASKLDKPPGNNGKALSRSSDMDDDSIPF